MYHRYRIALGMTGKPGELPVPYNSAQVYTQLLYVIYTYTSTVLRADYM